MYRAENIPFLDISAVSIEESPLPCCSTPGWSGGFMVERSKD
jgi:hypothetical protein